MSYKKNTRLYTFLVIFLVIVLIIGVIFINKGNKNKTEGEFSEENLPKSAPLEVESLIELQRDNGPSAILEIDCNTESTPESKEYCFESQKILKSIYNK